MKPLGSYLCGKVRLSPQILRYIPQHRVYCEPFFGMGAVFFKKGFYKTKNIKDYIEVIGDIDGDVTNFLKQLRDFPDLVIKEISKMECSSNLHKLSDTRSNYYKKSNKIKQASLFYFNVSTGIFGLKNDSFLFSVRKNAKNVPLTLKNKVSMLKQVSERLRNCYIVDWGYEKTIEKTDLDDTFFYLDPPYKDTHKYDKQGSFDYDLFADKVKELRGKFALSHYDNEWVRKNFDNDNYFIYDLSHTPSVGKTENNNRVSGKQFTKEVLITNYDVEKTPLWTDIPKDSILFT